VLLYLPALGLAFAQRGALWRALLPLPAFRILLLLAWAVLSLLWAPLHRPEDEVGRLLSVLAFVLGRHCLFFAAVLRPIPDRSSRGWSHGRRRWRDCHGQLRGRRHGCGVRLIVSAAADA
jgi:hypothetical protein